LVLKVLLERDADDAEVTELVPLREKDPLIASLLAAQRPDGSWEADGRMWQGSPLRATALALMRLGYVGLEPDRGAVCKAVEYVFSQQRDDGAWDIPGSGGDDADPEGYDMIPLQTAIPLRGIAAAGWAQDPRAERAYEWLLAQRLDDGAWPTGTAAGVYGYVAGYRRLAHSRWGCRSNTTGAVLCLAHHPRRRNGPAARRALDLLLGRETRETRPVGFEVARVLGAEPVRGLTTFYARYDLAQILDLCWRVGATLEDPRVADLGAFVRSLRGARGLWVYERRPQTSRWLTFDLLRSLAHLHKSGDWQSGEPRTPFTPYPSRPRRY
jgi:hypothetical protein